MALDPAQLTLTKDEYTVLLRTVAVPVSADHGDEAGGSLHEVATTAVAGFMSAADKLKLDGLEAVEPSEPFDPPVHGRVTAAGTLTFGKGISLVTALGNGFYLIDLETPIAENEMCFIVVPESGIYRFFGAAPVNDSQIELRFWDPDGVGTNTNFRITVFEVSL
jgi:hypothetical protein